MSYRLVGTHTISARWPTLDRESPDSPDSLETRARCFSLARRRLVYTAVCPRVHTLRRCQNPQNRKARVSVLAIACTYTGFGWREQRRMRGDVTNLRVKKFHRYKALSLRKQKLTTKRNSIMIQCHKVFIECFVIHKKTQRSYIKFLEHLHVTITTNITHV